METCSVLIRRSADATVTVDGLTETVVWLAEDPDATYIVSATRAGAVITKHDRWGRYVSTHATELAWRAWPQG